MRLFCQAAHGLRHTVEKEGFRFLFAAVAVGCGDQFLIFGNSQRCE